MMVLRWLVVSLLATQSVFACDQHHSCSACASDSYLDLSCRWCPLSSSCYAAGDLFNPCHSSEEYVYGVNCPEYQIENPSQNWQIDRAYSDLFYSYTAYCGQTDQGKPLQFAETKWGQQNPDFTLLGQTSKNDLFGFVGYDARVGAIKIVFRGTKMSDFANAVTDLHFSMETCSFCGDTKVHAGFHEGFNTLINAGMSGQIEAAIGQYPNAPVHCTGHSLGASLAVLSALWVRNFFPSIFVSMYTFGQPRVGHAPFAKFLMQTGIEHFRVVQQKDVIPHLPPVDLKFRHSTVEVWFPSVNAQPRFSDMAESHQKSSSNSLHIHMSVESHLKYFGFYEDCNTVNCICPGGVPSLDKCGGSKGNYEIKCVRCFAPYTLGGNGQCTR